MSTNIANQSPYLRTSRNFPDNNPQALSVEVNRAYVDTAEKVNDRVIGIFATNTASITGEKWYLSGGNSRQQTLRRVYTFTATGNIAHGLNFSSVSQISPRSYGSFTDGTNWYGAIYAGSTTVAGQVSFYVTSTNIVVGAGAGAPSITNGTIVLEWLSQI
jgi:hypothetical protein